jgi:erythromycin esterase-like protein
MARAAVTPRATDELAEIDQLARPLRTTADLGPLLERIGDARFVLLGEASHGTADHYGWRAAITRRLIAERGFSFVAVEGDWPDCFTVNEWVKDRADADLDAAAVLRRFERWPTWMWANAEVAAFADWLRAHNRRSGAGVGFYGLDVYSLWESLDRITGYLREHAPDALADAAVAAGCFEPYQPDPQRYAWATRMVPASCEDEVIWLLRRMSGLAGERPRAQASGDGEAELDAVQNAEVVAGAERYYRTMVQADGESWNVRDCHMADTLDRLCAHHGPAVKAVVWAHNTHVGDARATDMTAAGMVNLGQLVRERHERDGVVLVGFGSGRGEVIAADAWGDPLRRMAVPDAVGGSHESLIEEATGGGDSLLVFPDDRSGPWLSATRGHRAIGVVYRPARDGFANWVRTVMGRRYDAFCHLAITGAVHPLHDERPQPGAEQETFPWAT